MTHSMPFVHFGVHSEYSIHDSIIRIDELVATAAKDGMPALALTDQSNLYAAVKFYRACLKYGVKPIFGSDVCLNDDRQRATLLAMNNHGWRQLTELVSKGYTDGMTLDKPVLQREWIFDQSEDVIVLLGQHSDVGQALCSNNPDRAQPLLAEWQQQFSDRVYIAITRNDRDHETLFIQRATALAAKMGIGVVAHNDVRFMQASDFDAHEARVCIASGYVLADPRRPKDYTEQQYFKSQQQMQALFSDLPEALQNTYYLAQRCSVTLTLGENFLPNYPVPEEHSIATYFAYLSEQGLNERLDQLYPEKPSDWAQQRQAYDERLKYEIDIILKMGFPGYFLIVMDFIQWAKNNGVPVGPGRGSGAGSLVAYSLKITDLDPLAYDLLFERFLNPERVSMPDFDVDFCISGRDRVIEYVSQHYGRDAVSQIVTFGTMAAKGAIRDVARVLGKPYGLADRLSKLVPTKPLGIDLKTAIEMEAQIKDMVSNPNHPDYDDASEIWEMALKLEGITRNTGKHAGGVLIAPGKITDFSAISCEADGSGRVSQLDKDDVEAIGLVKFDFLGLRNLTVIDEAVQTINRRRAEQNMPELDLNKVPLDDPETYKLLQQSKTTAVFQLESAGMKKYLAKLRPNNIEDIIAMCALYRPGPLDAGMVEMYIDRKHGREKVVYDHPELEDILGNTYGVIVYQEQVMQISQVLAGYTLGGADMLRRAMGKKKPEEMAKQREVFVSGASGRGIAEDVSGGIFDLMEKFAGYGFNKSHSAAYGVVAYHTAWLKTHYPAEFMAAVLSSEMQNTDNIVFLIDDCRSIGLEVSPPSINRSHYRFVAEDDTTIVYGLGAIKGVGEAAMQSVIDARRHAGEFVDLFDFCHRVDLKKINKRTLEALIRAGAMDCLQLERSLLMEILPEAVQAADQARNNRESGLVDLFGEVEQSQQPTMSYKIKAWSDEVRLQGEKETLGLYLTGHPIDVYRAELKHFIPHRLVNVSGTRRGVTTVFAGLVIDIAHFPNRTVITLDDSSARLEVSTNQERFQRFSEIIQLGEVVVIEGEISEREGYDRPMGRLNKAFSLTTIRRKRVNKIQIQLDEQGLSNDRQLKAFKQKLQPFCLPSGGVPIHFAIEQDFATAELKLGKAWLVDPNNELLRMLRDEYSSEQIIVNYQLKSRRAEA